MTHKTAYYINNMFNNGAKLEDLQEELEETLFNYE